MRCVRPVGRPLDQPAASAWIVSAHWTAAAVAAATAPGSPPAGHTAITASPAKVEMSPPKRAMTAPSEPKQVSRMPCSRSTPCTPSRVGSTARAEKPETSVIITAAGSPTANGASSTWWSSSSRKVRGRCFSNDMAAKSWSPSASPSRTGASGTRARRVAMRSASLRDWGARRDGTNAPQSAQVAPPATCLPRAPVSLLRRPGHASAGPVEVRASRRDHGAPQCVDPLRGGRLASVAMIAACLPRSRMSTGSPCPPRARGLCAPTASGTVLAIAVDRP